MFPLSPPPSKILKLRPQQIRKLRKVMTFDNIYIKILIIHSFAIIQGHTEQVAT
jgi:hypothetical protein